MAYPEPKQVSVQGLMRRALHGIVQFPDTPIPKLVGRIRAVDRRRAKNKVARASRKANR